MAAAPLPEHELLKRFEGTWDVETRIGEKRGRGVCRCASQRF